ncbi:hypothetical protein PACTADRAFT_85423 [Pachysolen tannophilus NRRL Y-2460]|uniref:Lariat debranching enzyme C-terminal domain-containing protein n=1 Tax=Pachysolen tannophilus NRRL Y-2460 TaxID=669874 RepID=A0A1E4TU76_PACTA|nr:hypothetical protein PACTADRAFT_85423 [Pachysolen tannophilus NRRL Y-2460]
MSIAIEGCCHGELDQIYNSLLDKASRINQALPDLLIICGDFQSVRNEADLNCISMPIKYRKLGDFQSYYTGVKKAPLMTIFIGGNHEASNYLQELKFGGWVAPNIYYLGHSGCIWYKGLRISGISGIWYPYDFSKPRLEKLPYDQNSIRSIYHVRKLDFLKQFLIKQPISVMLSHDWPQGIENYGNLNRLLRFKPFFQKDIISGKLGSPVNRILLSKLMPEYWFSAHLHVKFEAEVFHESSIKKRKNSLDKNENLELENTLDKCLPKRNFLELLHIPVTSTKHPSFIDNQNLYWDKEYIAITKVFHNMFIHTDYYKKLYKFEEIFNIDKDILDELKREINIEFEKLNEKSHDSFQINPNFFVKTANTDTTELKEYENPQTTTFLSNFNINQ